MRWETHAVLLLLLVGVVAVAACADTGAVAVLVRSGAVPGCVVARVGAGDALVRGGVRALVGSRLVLALLRESASADTRKQTKAYVVVVVVLLEQRHDRYKLLQGG